MGARQEVVGWFDYLTEYFDWKCNSSRCNKSSNVNNTRAFIMLLYGIAFCGNWMGTLSLCCFAGCATTTVAFSLLRGIPPPLKWISRYTPKGEVNQRTLNEDERKPTKSTGDQPLVELENIKNELEWMGTLGLVPGIIRIYGPKENPVSRQPPLLMCNHGNVQ